MDISTLQPMVGLDDMTVMLSILQFPRKQKEKRDSMKKFFILSICFILLLSGCRPQDTNEKTSKGENSMSQQLSSQEIASSVKSEIVNDQILDTQQALEKSSTQNADKLITKSYPQAELISFLSYRGSDNFNTQLYSLNNKFPIECIRTFDNAVTYCVYKLKEGGLLYVYFDGFLSYDSDYANQETLRFANYVFVVKKPLKQEDFKNIKKGSSLEDVEMIDPGTKLINSIQKEYLRGDNMTCHMVNDGFVQIRYTHGEERDPDTFMPYSYMVESIKFIPNGKSVNDGYNYTILPQDYIQ